MLKILQKVLQISFLKSLKSVDCSILSQMLMLELCLNECWSSTNLSVIPKAVSARQL